MVIRCSFLAILLYRSEHTNKNIKKVVCGTIHPQKCFYKIYIKVYNAAMQYNPKKAKIYTDIIVKWS